jgi:hypothetical protein
MNFNVTVTLDGAYKASFSIKPTGLLTVTP